MKTRIAQTFNAKIYTGLKEGYNGIAHPIERLHHLLQEYCDTVSYCVSVQPVKYIYKNGTEEGAVINLINYPRFPETDDEILARALEIGKMCIENFGQNRVSVETPTRTYLIERKEGDMNK